jgi:hypothetical protein
MVSWLGLKNKVDGLSVLWHQNHWDGFLQLASKLVVTVSPGLASKPVVRVFQFGSQNRQLRFDDLGIKITDLVSWFMPQN